MKNEIYKLSGAEQARLIREKQASPSEVLEAVLQHIHRMNPLLNAICTLDEEGARASAREAECQVMGGQTKPSLGVPFVVKDMIATKGVLTTFGSKAYQDYLPEADDISIARLKAAGAILLGKTNTPEFAYEGVTENKLFGVTKNPWNLNKTPGGSSGGSAAAVASGMGALAVGNDGGGSVRIPTCFCGLYGLKPSYGRIPLYPGCRDPQFPGASSWEELEAIGPMTRTVEDSALMLSVMEGPGYMDRHSWPVEGTNYLETIRNHDLKGLRIAWWPRTPYASVDIQVLAACEKAAKVFQDLGATVEEVESPLFSDPGDIFWGTVAGNTDLAGMRRLVETLGDDMSQTVRSFVAQDWSAEQLIDAHFGRQKLNITLRNFMKPYDLLLTPTLTVPAFDLGLGAPEIINGQPAKGDFTTFTYLFNLTGQPAANVPAGWTADGLPVGLQIVGRPWDDALVLRASAAYEEARPWADKWPMGL